MSTDFVFLPRTRIPDPVQYWMISQATNQDVESIQGHDEVKPGPNVV
jgi:hypothetical protein